MTFNRGFQRIFKENELTIGLMLPLESYPKDVPQMHNQIELVQFAEAKGIGAIWFRDIPLRDPNFGDVGQIYEPFSYMSYLAAHTSEITLATGASIATLHHPIDIAKSAATVDVLSQGRVVLGLASGDRELEFPAYGVDKNLSKLRYQQSVEFIRALHSGYFPVIRSPLGTITRADVLPKPYNGAIGLLSAGNATQRIEWLAQHCDGWITYYKNDIVLKRQIAKWQELTAETYFKPVGLSMMLDLHVNDNHPAEAIPLGLRSGYNALVELLYMYRSIGLNHIIFILKHSSRSVKEVITLLENVQKEF